MAIGWVRHEALYLVSFSARQICSNLDCRVDGDKVHPMLMETQWDRRRHSNNVMDELRLEIYIRCQRSRTHSNTARQLQIHDAKDDMKDYCDSNLL
jgi:hypothetical protein